MSTTPTPPLSDSARLRILADRMQSAMSRAASTNTTSAFEESRRTQREFFKNLDAVLAERAGSGAAA